MRWPGERPELSVWQWCSRCYLSPGQRRPVLAACNPPVALRHAVGVTPASLSNQSCGSESPGTRHFVPASKVSSAGRWLCQKCLAEVWRIDTEREIERRRGQGLPRKGTQNLTALSYSTSAFVTAGAAPKGEVSVETASQVLNS